MRWILRAILVSVGSLVGLWFALVEHGLGRLDILLATSFLFALLTLVFGEFCIQANGNRRVIRKRKIRQESNGSFSQRLANYRGHVESETSDLPVASKMPFWISDEIENLCPDPPKDVSWIRQILMRIQKILAGYK